MGDIVKDDHRVTSVARRVHVCLDGVLDAAKSGGWRVFTSTLRALAKLGDLKLSAIVPDDRDSDFADVRIVQRQISPELVPRRLRRLLPMVERVAGWNLIVKATRADRA